MMVIAVMPETEETAETDVVCASVMLAVLMYLCLYFEVIVIVMLIEKLPGCQTRHSHCRAVDWPL